MKKEKLSEEQIKDLLSKFNPRDYSTGNLDAVLNGNQDDVIKSLRDIKFSKLEEKMLIGKAAADVVKAYIEVHHGIYCEAAQIELIKRADDELLEYFISNSSFGISRSVEVYLLEHSAKDTVVLYTKRHQLSADAHKALVLKHDIWLLKAFLDNHSLSDEAALELVEGYNDAEISELISHPRFYLSKEAEARLIHKTNRANVFKYILKYELHKPAQLSLVERGDHELIMEYMQFYRFTSEDAISALVGRFNYEEIVKCMERSTLPSQAQITIVKSTQDELINMLIDRGNLSIDAEVALVREGTLAKRHARIMRYIEKWRPYSQMRDAILERGNSTEIKTCIKKKSFFGSQEEDLIRRGFKDEIELYLKFYHPDWKISE